MKNSSLKKFITHLILISISIFSISLLINISIYYFVDTTLKTQHKFFVGKYKYLNDTSENFDTLFFGTSKIFDHIIPSLYDSITGHKSFNFGVPSCYPPESTKLLEKLLDLPNVKKVKRIFIELQGLMPVKDNADAEETYYNIDFYYGLRIILFHQRQFNWKLLFDFSDALFKKYSRAIRLLFYRDKIIDTTFIAKYAGLSSSGLMVDYADKESQKLLKKQSQQLKEKYKEPINHIYYEQSLDLGNEEQTVYQDYLESVLDRCVAMGIKPIFIITPGISRNMIARQHSKLLKKNKYIILDYSSRQDYPELYDFELMRNISHFNIKGANLFTKIFASEVKDQGL